MDEFAEGVLVGLLVGEGSFGGDGRQAQVALRMHTRHEALFRWLEAAFPEGRLYGPYHHGGRSYYQWMIRGRALRDQLLPLLRRRLTPALDAYATARLDAMVERYFPDEPRVSDPLAGGPAAFPTPAGSHDAGALPAPRRGESERP